MVMDKPSFKSRLYGYAMGVSADRLAGAHLVGMRLSTGDLLYYLYHKGFWAYARGLVYRMRLRSCDGRFYLGSHTNILFPNHLSVGRNVAIGNFVYMNCIGEKGIFLGNNVRVREFAWIQVTSHLTLLGDGLTIGDNTYIGPFSILGAAGGITIGRNVTMGAYVQLLAENHGFDDPNLPINEQGVERKGIVLDGIHIGAGAVIGAGSVVTRNIDPGWVAAGNPARPIREREKRPKPLEA